MDSESWNLTIISTCRSSLCAKHFCSWDSWESSLLSTGKPYCTSSGSPGSLVYVCEVSRGCDYPRGHRRSFYTGMSRFSKTVTKSHLEKRLLWALTSSHMHTTGFIESTSVVFPVIPHLCKSNTVTGITWVCWYTLKHFHSDILSLSFSLEWE